MSVSQRVGMGVGLRDWIIQRATAVYLGLYIIFIAAFVVLNSPLTYDSWVGLFELRSMRIASLLAILSIVMHAWVGIWGVATDYLKHTVVRMVFLGLVWLGLFAILIWGVEVLWGFSV